MGFLVGIGVARFCVGRLTSIKENSSNIKLVYKVSTNTLDTFFFDISQSPKYIG